MRHFLTLLMLPLLAITLSSCASTSAVEEEHVVYFKFGSPSLSKEARAKLDTIAETLRNDGSIASVSVIGYADTIGSDKTNEALSKKRAETVKRYLETHGYRAISVGDTKWVGKTQASATCGDTASKKTVACLQPDRKVEIIFNYTYDFCRNMTSRRCAQD